MLNLKRSVVNEYWKQSSPRMAKALSFMEQMEYWPVDAVPSVDEAIQGMAKKMDGTEKETIIENAEAIMFVMAYMSSGRALRLMNWFDERFSGLSVEMIKEAQLLSDEVHVKLLIDRLQTIKSLSLMNKIFAPARTRIILEMLKNMED